MSRNDGVYPPSVKPGRPRVDHFPGHWRRVAFRELLEPAFRPIVLDPEVGYQLVVAKRNRGGIAPREILAGKDIKTQGQYRLREGDFVIAKRQIVHGACGFVPRELDGAIVSGEYDVFRTKESLSPDFLALFTHTDYFQQTCFHSSVGVTVEKLIFRTNRWLRFEMPLPTVTEQARIVNVAKCFGEHLNALDKALVAKRSMKNGLMQQLLTGQRRFPEFKDRSWPTVRLGDVVQIDPESLPNDTGQSYQFFYIDVSSVEDGRYVIPSSPVAFGEAPSRARRIIRRNDVLMSTVRPNLQAFCRVSESRSDLICSTGFAVIRPQSEDDSRYMLECLFSAKFMRQILARIAGSSFPAIASSDIAHLYVPWPDPDERARIGQVLSAARREIDLLIAQRKQVEFLKHGVLSRLLSGGLADPVSA